MTSAAAKPKLMGLAYGQAKVGAAAVTFIMVGNPGGYMDLARLYQPMVDAGAIDQPGVDGIVGMANSAHGSNPQMQHDEAIRSAALAGMTLMLAAHAKGLASGPMIGFDAAAVATEFGLKEGEFPVMLITCGNAAPGNRPRKPRRPVSETLSFA